MFKAAKTGDVSMLTEAIETNGVNINVQNQVKNTVKPRGF